MSEIHDDVYIFRALACSGKSVWAMILPLVSLRVPRTLISASSGLPDVWRAVVIRHLSSVGVACQRSESRPTLDMEMITFMEEVGEHSVGVLLGLTDEVVWCGGAALGGFVEWDIKCWDLAKTRSSLGWSSTFWTAEWV